MNDNKEVILTFHFINDGTTTIQYKTGKNQDIGLKIAIFLREKLITSNEKNKEFSIKSINNENFNYLLEYLEENMINNEEKKLSTGIQYKLSSDKKDSFNITRYNNGNTFFQGKPLFIYNTIYEFITELLDNSDIININNSVYEVNITQNDIKNVLQSKMPISHQYLNSFLQKSFISCIALNSINIDLPDYSSFVFSALRGLEGHMKCILKENNISLGNNKFHMFDCNNKKEYFLKDDYKKNIQKNGIISTIESCYNFYNIHRHGLFHTNQIVSTSRVIEKKDEAQRIIDTIFKLIEETYNAKLHNPI